MRNLATAGGIAALMFALASFTLFPAPAPAADAPSASGHIDEIGMLDSECQGLMDQFDAAKSTDEKALDLRKRAGNQCADASKNSKQDGIKHMKTALKMIGVE